MNKDGILEQGLMAVSIQTIFIKLLLIKLSNFNVYLYRPFQKILALVAPPCSDESARKRKISETNGKPTVGNGLSLFSQASKNKSKLSNNAFCDYCLEGGDLICCDECPAALHLKCK